LRGDRVISVLRPEACQGLVPKPAYLVNELVFIQSLSCRFCNITFFILC
jgi:hypothetical protein